MPRRTRLTDATVARLTAEPAEYTVWDTRTPGLGVRIRSSGARSFVFGGQANTESVARRHTLGAVAQWSVAGARRACLELQTGARASARSHGNADPRHLQFRDFVQSVWGPAFLDRCNPSRRKRLEADLRGQLLPAFAAMPLERLSPNAVHRWFDRYSATAPTGANHALKLLRRILQYAVTCGHLHRNPTRSVRLNPGIQHTRFLARDELRRVHRTLEACERERSSRAPQADMIRLLLLTGCRRGEIVNLRWDEVCGGTLRLRDSKTGPRTVYLNAEAQRVIARQPRRASAYVFPSPLNPARPRYRELSLWNLVRRRANLTDVRLHDCRHTFASQAALNGVPLPVVARLLGHRHATMTLRYAHVRDSDIEAAAERVGVAVHALLQADTT